ncbi:MAG: hypothetical protein EPO25_10165 [Gammaproteobacteria bacterium]|nr:MAG: hypothetical protein EPO25_10165 [Gammaproteobacteria bacterium]
MLKQAGFRAKLYKLRLTLGGGLIASSSVPYKANIARYQRHQQADTQFAQSLADEDIRGVVIGDARRGGRIGDAIQDAYAAVMLVCAPTATDSPLSC